MKLLFVEGPITIVDRLLLCEMSRRIIDIARGATESTLAIGSLTNAIEFDRDRVKKRL
jgi:hypothetical protein